MVKMKKIYKISSFLNASFTVNLKRADDHQRANTFEIRCDIITSKKIIPFSDFEKAIEAVTNPLSGKYLNDLPQFKSRLFSTEVLAEYLANEIDKELRKIDSKLSKIEVSEDPIRTVCFEVE